MRDIIETMIKILLSFSQAKDKSKTTLLQQIAVLLEAHQQDEKTLLALKQCLKAWDVPFEGSNTIPDLSPEFYQQLPPEHFGKYFNQKMYPRMYVLSHLAYTAEQNGIPAEHATKLCVMFTDEKTALSYLQQYIQSAQTSTTPFHDAFLFNLPDFQAPGFLDPQTGCKFELFQVREKGKTIENLLSKEFKQLLPFAFELQQRVVAAKNDKKVQKLTTEQNVESFLKEVEMLKESMAVYNEKTKAFLELNKNNIDSSQLKNEIDKLKLQLNTLLKRFAIAFSNVPLDQKNQCIELFEQYIKSTLKRYDSLENKKSDLDADEESEYYHLATVVSEQLCGLAALCAGKRLKDVTLLQLRAFYEVYKLDSSLSYKLFIDNGIPAKYYAEFKNLDRTKAGTNLPNIVLEGEAIGHSGFYLMKVPVSTDEQQAARAACFGKLTHCCQSLSGEAGHACVKHGLTSPNGGFYVLCQGNAKTPKVTDSVIAQSWAWRSQSEAIVFDSIEIGKRDPNTKQCVIDFYHYLGKVLVDKGYTTKVACGASSGISNEVGVATASFFKEFFKDYQGYNDSRVQRAIYDTKQPYLFYHTYEECRIKTKEMIEAAVKNSTVSLHGNQQFIEMLNWTILSGKKDILQEIESALVEKNKVDEVKQIIKALEKYHIEQDVSGIVEHFDYVDIKDKNGNTPLMHAIKKGKDALCIQLLQKRADINVEDNRGMKLLSLAAEKPLLNVCLMLISMGVALETKDENGRTPLLIACQHNNHEISLALIEKGSDVNSRNNNRSTPLIEAAKGDRRDVCAALIEKRAEVNASDNFNDTPLLCAAKNRCLDICLLLINHGADINARDIDRNTPLILAAEQDCYELCVALLNKGADINACNKFGETVLTRAIQERSNEVCELLIENGVNVNIRNGRGIPVLILALRNGLDQEVCLALIEKTIDVDLTDNNRKTPLLMVAEKGNLALASALINKGANVNSTDREGRPPLMWAAGNGHLAICQELIKEGANVNWEDNNGATALLWAAAKGYYDICVLLLNHGANVNLGSDSPLTWAAINHHHRVCTLLINAGAMCDQMTLQKLQELNQYEINNALAMRQLEPEVQEKRSTKPKL